MQFTQHNTKCLINRHRSAIRNIKMANRFIPFILFLYLFHSYPNICVCTPYITK